MPTGLARRREGGSPPLRIGIVGGTFDPIHMGHVAMAEAARECAQLDRVLLVPADVPPHRAAATAPAADRLEMSRLAVSSHPHLEVSDIELRRGGPSYTVDTVRELKWLWPDDELFLVLGWDAARDIHAWRDPEEVLSLARPVIVTRPGYPTPTVADLESAGLDPERAIICHAHTPDVDSTDVRRLIEQGLSLSGLVDPQVEAYLRRRGLYPS